MFSNIHRAGVMFGHVLKRAQFTMRRTGQTINTDFPLSGHFDYRPFDIVKGHINIVEGCGWAPPWSYKYFFFTKCPHLMPIVLTGKKNGGGSPKNVLPVSTITRVLVTS